MAYYRRRRSSYRRRREPRGLLKIIAVLLVVVVCAAAVVQTRRLRDAGEMITQLKQQLSSAAQTAPETEVVPAGEGGTTQGETLAYQKLYPEMKAESPLAFTQGDPKAVFLTFDDGPSTRTKDILDALHERGQKATFFVVGKNIAGNEDLLKRMASEGHTIGIHGFSHDYAATYVSVEAFLEDFHQAYQAVYTACGVYPVLLRFPGGSVNAYNRTTYQQIIAEMLRRGFVYHDWNISPEDMNSRRPQPAQLVQKAIDAIGENSRRIVLLHDAADKKATADAVPLLLDELQVLGYYADKLDASVQPIMFAYNE